MESVADGGGGRKKRGGVSERNRGPVEGEGKLEREDGVYRWL